MRKSQSALEYLMTYGWAILIIVIVAAVLYSFGIFNPSSSISTTITGFSGLGSPQALCMANGGLRLQLGNNLGQTINVTRINITTNGATQTILPNKTIPPQGTYIFYIPNVCSTSAGAKYSFTSSVTYAEPGQVFPGPYSSSGTASGTVSPTILPGYAASFDGQPRYDGNPPITHVSGTTAYMTSTAPSLTTDSDFNFTASMWVYLNYYWSPPNSSVASSGWTPIFGFGYYQCGYSANLPNSYGSSTGAFGSHTCCPGDQGINVNANKFNNSWNFVTYSRSYVANRLPGHTAYIYSIDGQMFGPYYLNYSVNDTNAVMIGSQFECDGKPFYGYLSNVQLYNNQSLSVTSALQVWVGISLRC